MTTSNSLSPSNCGGLLLIKLPGLFIQQERVLKQWPLMSHPSTEQMAIQMSGVLQNA